VRHFFGRPHLKLDDLARLGGFSLAELEQFYVGTAPLCDLSHVIPLCNTFPMGFSWSSSIAQSYLLSRCVAAGLRKDLFLADDNIAPTDLRQVYGLATDDLIVFTRDDADLAKKTVCRFDQELKRAGVVRAAEKDITATCLPDGIPCIGIDVCDGTYLAPAKVKLCRVLIGTGHLLVERACISPVDLAALLGVMSWFAQLNRPIYSCFDTVYEFARLEPQDDKISLPNIAGSELLVFAVLSPLLEADLTRPWLDSILACDASSVFGFGLAVAPTTPDRAREIARFADITGAFVRVDRTIPHPHDEDERPRRGVRCELGLSKHNFKPVISSRARYKAHSGALEATGLSMTIRWVMRDIRRHSRRVVVLVDAQAVLGAAARGRSSARTIKREIRRYGALVLGGDLLVRLVYIPSEDNLGDAPSRNKSRVISGARFDKGQQRRARITRQKKDQHLAFSRCPGCGVAASQHPLHAPASLRGGDLFCRPARDFGYQYKNGTWVSEVQHREKLIEQLPFDDPLRVALRPFN